MKFTAVGDALIQRRIPEKYKGYEQLLPFIMQGDMRFFNLETTLNYEGDCFASQHSGGTYLRANPEVLDDLKKLGFNTTSFNNNHVMDYSYGGLIESLKFVKESGLVNAGVGRNMAEAAAPRFLDTENGRVALISINSTFHPAMMAGIQSVRMPGRPGINGLRYKTVYTVPQAEFDTLKKVAKESYINAARDVAIMEGYTNPGPEDELVFGNHEFKLGEKTEQHTYCNQIDLARVKTAIDEARLQADYVMISLHAHEHSGLSKDDIADFIEEFAHFCIDNGADGIIGHGPHVLRAIEVYKEKPIFYSLGDFILQLYDMEFVPEEQYAGYGLASHSSNIYEFVEKRSQGFKKGLMETPAAMQTVIPYWEMEDGKLTCLKLLPVEMIHDGHHSEIGLPRIAEDLSFVEKLKNMSEPYGVKMTLGEDKIITCTW